MRRGKHSAFALFEVLIGLAIFVIGTLVLGRSVQNCINATGLSAQEDRIRQLLANRMAEIQATPGLPDQKRETKVETGYGPVKISQKTAPAGLKDEKDVEFSGINQVILTAEWSSHGKAQSRSVEFYVYRAG